MTKIKSTGHELRENSENFEEVEASEMVDLKRDEKENDVVVNNEECETDDGACNVTDSNDEKVEKKIIKKDKSELRREQIDAVKLKEKKVFTDLVRDISKRYSDLRSDCYAELDANIDMILKNIGYGVVVEGKPGTGKTFRILNRCYAEHGEDAVAYADSFTTPTALYVWMYENKDKSILCLDDCAGLMDNMKVLAMLKGALWHLPDGKTRVVNYMTTKPPMDENGEPVERSFVMKARIIIITNYLNEDSPHVKAILSRVNKVVVEVDVGELVKILEQVIERPYHSLTKDERKEVLDYLKEMKDKRMKNLNIRTLLRMMDYREYSKIADVNWKQLSLRLLKEDSNLAVVERILDDVSLSSVDEMVEAFEEETGKSRSSFFRLKAKIMKLREAKKEELKASDVEVSSGG